MRDLIGHCITVDNLVQAHQLRELAEEQGFKETSGMTNSTWNTDKVFSFLRNKEIVTRDLYVEEQNLKEILFSDFIKDLTLEEMLEVVEAQAEDLKQLIKKRDIKIYKLDDGAGSIIIGTVDGTDENDEYPYFNMASSSWFKTAEEITDENVKKYFR